MIASNNTRIGAVMHAHTTLTIKATARRYRDGIWTLTISLCPYCGIPSFGHRATHCLNHPNNSKGYVLAAEVVHANSSTAPTAPKHNGGYGITTAVTP